MIRPVPKKKRVKNPELIKELDKKIDHCEYCGATTCWLGFDWHHIIPRSQGGSDLPENLLKMCRFPCHDKAGRREIPASYLQHIAERRTL